MPNIRTNIWTPSVEDETDYLFIQRVAKEITQSCALPMGLPTDRIPEYIVQAAQWFWENVDFACEERTYFIQNSDICKCNKLNKIIQLPQQIMGVHGVYKTSHRYNGQMGDFSLERMMMSSYSMFGGAGTVGGGFTDAGSTTFRLPDVIMSMYEISTFDEYLNPPLTYSFNPYSSKLNILGDLGSSSLILCCHTRCRIQDLYNSLYFFRLVVAYCKRSLSDIIGTWEFKLPGGVTINYSNISDRADRDIEKIEEWAEKNRAADFIMMPNTM